MHVVLSSAVKAAADTMCDQLVLERGARRTPRHQAAWYKLALSDHALYELGSPVSLFCADWGTMQGQHGPQHFNDSNQLF